MLEKIRTTVSSAILHIATVKFEPSDKRLMKGWALGYFVFVVSMFAIGYLLGRI